VFCFICILQNLQLQRQFAVRGSPEAEQLDALQTELLNRLQQDAVQFQDLQARLQLRVLQVHMLLNFKVETFYRIL
jgi:hypothetical protein